MSMRVAVVGAGAAGCFCAIQIKRRHPDYDVRVFESGPRPLIKVSLTGGGRCNLTNSFEGVDSLKYIYPRGEQLMKRALRRFSNGDTMRWFEKEGVRLTVQSDRCVFPVSQDAMQIVRTLENLMRRLSVSVECGRKVTRIADGFTLDFADGPSESFDRVVLTAGGSSEKTLRAMLPEDIEVTPTVPSLFTLKIADESLRALMGTVVQNAALSLCGTPFRSEGTLLITDWGVSGPATLKLSSYAARRLAEDSYRGELSINWLGCGEEDVRAYLSSTAGSQARKLLTSIHPEELTDRLWKHLCDRAGARADLRWGDLSGKTLNRLVNTLVSDTYHIDGRARFKEEFVTCGGIALSEVNLGTMESRKHPGLFFAGEVLDMDAITGGFNLQAAWSTGFVAAENV